MNNCVIYPVAMLITNYLRAPEDTQGVLFVTNRLSEDQPQLICRPLDQL